MTHLDEIKQRLMRDPDFVREYTKADAEYKSVEVKVLERSGKIAAMQKLVEEGVASGFGSRSADELFEAAVLKVKS